MSEGLTNNMREREKQESEIRGRVMVARESTTEMTNGGGGKKEGNRN